MTVFTIVRQLKGASPAKHFATLLNDDTTNLNFYNKCKLLLNLATTFL